MNSALVEVQLVIVGSLLEVTTCARQCPVFALSIEEEVTIHQPRRATAAMMVAPTPVGMRIHAQIRLRRCGCSGGGICARNCAGCGKICGEGVLKGWAFGEGDDLCAR